MQEHYTPKGKHLTIEERRLIERWKCESKSNRQIATLLGKAPQTIHNEIKRGTTLQQVRKGRYQKVYSADYAQSVYQTNRKKIGEKTDPHQGNQATTRGNFNYLLLDSSGISGTDKSRYALS